MALWPVFAITLAIFGVAIAAMAIGRMLTGRCLRGTCGGADATGPDGESLSCAGCPNRRRREPTPAESSDYRGPAPTSN
jgi:hypothetical protein